MTELNSLIQPADWKAEFDAYGESAAGPNMSTVYTHPEAGTSFKTDKPGMILASVTVIYTGCGRVQKDWR